MMNNSKKLQDSTKKINVMFLFHDSELNNGAFRSMIDVIEGLVFKYNINPIIVYPDNKGTAINYLESKGISCYNIRYGHWAYCDQEKFSKKLYLVIRIIGKFGYALKNLSRFKEIIIKENIDICYSNTSVIYIGALLHSRFNIPHIWHIREFGAEDHNLKFIPSRKFLYKIMSNSSDAIIYISKSVQKKYHSFIKSDIIQKVIYNDISKDFINPKKRFNYNKKLLLSVIGDIKEGKGQLEVVQAVYKLYLKNFDIELHIAGKQDGSYYQRISQYVKDHNMESYVVFDGFIRDVNSYRNKMDVGIVSSSSEAFGRVTIEGMLSMMAMIGANTAGTKELIIDKENGLLYESHNIDDLASKIELLYQDRELLYLLASNGFKYAKDNFTIASASDSIYKLITEILT